jgi:putative PIN family toxin of toxin-antitoxin system
MKVIFDTNVWIGFLIGKRLSAVAEYIFNRQIIVVISEQLLQEIKEVTCREKLKKYFLEENVLELLNLLEIIAEKFEVKPTYFICRDPKDNFLLDLIACSKADYLVTGDNDLLVLNPFEKTVILTPGKFEEILINSMNR